MAIGHARGAFRESSSFFGKGSRMVNASARRLPELKAQTLPSRALTEPCSSLKFKTLRQNVR